MWKFVYIYAGYSILKICSECFSSLELLTAFVFLFPPPLNPWLPIYLTNVIDDWAGQIVGVIVFNGVPHPESKTLMNVMFTSHPSPRWLAETKSSYNTTLIAQVLVRRTIAWVTGVVLLIATLLGVRSVLNIN